MLNCNALFLELFLTSQTSVCHLVFTESFVVFYSELWKKMLWYELLISSMISLHYTIYKKKQHKWLEILECTLNEWYLFL